jgi:hypothetical protein
VARDDCRGSDIYQTACGTESISDGFHHSKITKVEVQKALMSARKRCGEKTCLVNGGLTAIHMRASIEVICGECFSSCKSLVSVTFAVDCKLSRLEQDAFSESGLTAIHIPASVEVICAYCISEERPLLADETHVKEA